MKLKIDVTKIDKASIYQGEKGKYITLYVNKYKEGENQYGDIGFVTQEISKERRDAGERSPIIGNAKETTPYAPPVVAADEDDDIPF
jgi:hypothetical protein